MFSFQNSNIFSIKCLFYFIPFQANVPFLQPLKTSEKRYYSKVFRGCGNGILAGNGLTTSKYLLKAAINSHKKRPCALIPCINESRIENYLHVATTRQTAERYSETCHTSKMALFALTNCQPMAIVGALQPMTIYAKSSIFDL